MNNKILYIGLIVIIAAIVVLAYFDYNVYCEKQMQSYMLQAAAYNNTALGLNVTYLNASKKNDYDQLINIANAMITNYQQAVNCDNEAMKYAAGVYKDYLTYDIMRLNSNIKLCNQQVDAINKIRNNDLSTISNLAKQMDDQSVTSKDYRNKEDEIIAANPDKFKFLNS